MNNFEKDSGIVGIMTVDLQDESLERCEFRVSGEGDKLTQTVVEVVDNGQVLYSDVAPASQEDVSFFAANATLKFIGKAFDPSLN